MKQRFLFFLLLLTFCVSPVPAAQRPTLAVLPFGVAKDRSSLRWLGPATSATLTEKLRRVPSLRVIPVRDVLRELKTARVLPNEAAWTPAVATQPLGRWLGADVLVIGALGTTGDRDIAAQILEISVPEPEQKKSDIWLAARFIQVTTGETLGRAFVEGRRDSILHLQQALLEHLGGALKQVPEALQLGAVRRPPTTDLKAYQIASETAQDLLTIQDMPRGTKKERAVKRALKQIKKALKKDPQYATAHTLRGSLLTLQGKPDEATAAYEQAA
ncbi:MAG: hypothetical protein O2954_00670, partial [bacterium]|nr:hypothetical protein [bacterium]